MRKRSKAKKHEAAKRKESPAAPASAEKSSTALPPANPPRANFVAFYASCALLAVWIVFLVAIAVLTLRGG